MWFGDEKNKSKLTIKDKIKILKKAFHQKLTANIVLKYLCKEYNLEKDEIFGFRIKHGKKKKDSEKIITSLDSILNFNFDTMDKKTGEQFLNSKKFMWENFFNDKKQEFVFPKNVDDLNLIDKYVLAISKSKVVEKRIENLSFLETTNTKKDIRYLARNSDSYSETHSYSFKALKEIIPWLLITNKNQYEILIEIGKNVNNKKYNFEKSKYISSSWVNDLIISPNAKRSLMQTIKVINSILKNIFIKK